MNYRSFTIIALIVSFFSIPRISADEEWERVLLATYARSGNHWMRNLIDEATHIMTGSVYEDDDPPHSSEPEPWGGFLPIKCKQGCHNPLPGEIVVIKTHFPASYEQIYDRWPYKRVVRIVRHPIDTFYSFYVYLNHNDAPDTKIPRKKLNYYISSWEKFQYYWDAEPDILTIRYEDLYNNPKYYLELVLDYIGYKVSKKDIDRAVKKYPPQGGLLKHIHHYTADDLNLIQLNLGHVMERFGYEIPKQKQSK